MSLECTMSKSVHRELTKNNYEEWGGGLTLEQYTEREIMLRKSNNSQANYEMWILKVNGITVSGCETYKSDAIAKIDGKIVRGEVYRVCSVFTMAEHRKNGYASKMMSLLNNELRKRPKSIGSVLYSDVGPVFYAKIGWETFPSKSLIVDTAGAICGEPDVTLLDDTTLKALFKNEQGLMLSDVMASDKNCFAIIPNFDNNEWFHLRSKFYARLKAPDSTLLLGACKGNDFVTWFYDYLHLRLIILFIRAENIYSLKELVKASVKEAQKHNFKLEAWDPTPMLQSALNEINIEFSVSDRVDSLSALCFWGEAPDSKPDIEWIHNEKYAWC